MSTADFDDFDDLVAACRRRLTGELYVLLGDLTEADDLVRSALQKAWQDWDRVSLSDDPVAEVRALAWRRTSGRLRRLLSAAGRRVRAAPELPAPELTPELGALQQGLGEVPLVQRRAVVLHHVAGRSVEQTAAALQVPVATAAGWLSRSRIVLSRAAPADVDLAGPPGRLPGGAP